MRRLPMGTVPIGRLVRPEITERGQVLIDYTDVGCWIVKGDPRTWDYFTALAEDHTPSVKPHVYRSGWTLGRTYRSEMIRKGDLIALWITGPNNPGIYEFGWVT